MSEQDREREQTLDEWWSSVIKRAFEQRHSEAYIAWHDMQAATAAAVPPGHVVVPVEPTIGRLMSMAIRDDHGLGVPGFYDNLSFTAGGPYWPPHQQRIEAAIARMRQLYEEATGQGFYTPEREDEYRAAAEGK